VTQTLSAPVEGNEVVVIEPPSGRVRRPTDLFALLFALALLFGPRTGLLSTRFFRRGSVEPA